MNEEHGDFQVVYLTGAPASGKSTLLNALAAVVSPLIPFSYSRALADHVRARAGRHLSEDEIRAESASVVTPGDVVEVDRSLQDLVRDNRGRSHLVIDSHAVTKERYGFRVTPFTIPALKAIQPTMLVVLYLAPQLTIDRIDQNPQGRPKPTVFEAGFHTELQASVAMIYGIQLGIPVYFLDGAKPTATLVDEIANRMRRR